MTESIDIEGLLAKRGILTAAQDNLWESRKYYRQPGWQYPLADLNGEIQGYRFKAADSESKRKYAWIGTKPSGIKYYILRTHDFVSEIAEAEDTAIIASGEPDVLAFDSAGIYNMFSWYGENSPPDSLAEDLKSWGVKKVVQFADSDTPGVDAAKKVAKMLSGTGIKYIAYRLPGSLGPKGDINKLWMASEFNAETFKQTLETIQMSPDDIIVCSDDSAFDESAPRREIVVTNASHSGNATLPQEFLDAIKARLGVTGFKENGFSDNIACVFSDHEHDDKKPAAGWNRKGFFKCFKCGTRNAKDTGEALGIKLADYLPASSCIPMPTTQVHEVEDASVVAEESEAIGTTPFIEKEEPPAKYVASTPSDIFLGKLICDRLRDHWQRLYGKWHQYGNGVWRLSKKKSAVKRAIWDLLEQYEENGFKVNESKVRSILDYVEVHLEVADSDINQVEYILPVKNGLVDLTTQELGPHRPELYLTTQTSVEYDPDAECPTWIAALERYFLDENGASDKKLISLVQEMFGYCLTADTTLEKMFWLEGVAGSGKSTVINVLKLLLGDLAVSINIAKLQDEKHVARLVGKRVAYQTEVNYNAALETEMLKQLISGENAPAKFLYKDSFTICPKAKFVVASNGLSRMPNATDGFYRRLVLIPFKHAIPDEQKDPQLITKLKAELPGILNWSLAGWHRVQSQGKFTIPSVSAQANAEYQSANDYAQGFVNDCCIVDERRYTPDYHRLADGSEIPAGELNTACNAWLQRQGLGTMTSRELAKEWDRLGFYSHRRRGGQYRQGIKLRA